jgi:hypothetical protein
MSEHGVTAIRGETGMQPLTQQSRQQAGLGHPTTWRNIVPRAVLLCTALLALPATAVAQCTPAFTVHHVWTQNASGTAKTTFTPGETIQFAAQVNNVYGGSGKTSLTAKTSFYNDSEQVTLPLGVSTWTWDTAVPATQGNYNLSVNVLDNFCGIYVSGNAAFTIQAAQNPGTVGQNSFQLEIVHYDTVVEAPLVYFRLIFADPNKTAVGFGFKGINGSGLAEENHFFSSPSYGRVSPGEVDYPFNELCGTASAYESDVQAWIDDNAGKQSEPVTIHLSCSSDFRNQVLNRALSSIKLKSRPFCAQALQMNAWQHLDNENYRDGSPPLCNVPYSITNWLSSSGELQPNNPAGAYRTDCSGFVSYAWQLTQQNGDPISPTTVALQNYSNDLADLSKGVTATALRAGFDKLKPGDIINNNLPDDGGHVVIFVNWLDQSRTSFLAYDKTDSRRNGFPQPTQSR